MKKYLIIGIFILGLGIIPKLSLADTLPYQPIYSTLSGQSGSFPQVDYPITTSPTTITSIQIIMASGYTYDPLYYLQQCTSINGSGCAGGASSWNNGSGFTLASSSIDGGLLTEYTYTATTDTIIIDPGQWINLTFYYQGGTFEFGGVTPTSTNVSVVHNFTQSNWEPFIVFNGYSPSVPGNAIPESFAYPTSSLVTPDFQNWVLSLNNLSTDTSYSGVVSYQLGGSWGDLNTTYSDYFTLNSGNASSVIWQVPKSQTLFNYQNNNASSAEWTALLQFATSGVSIIGSSSQMSFTITPTSTSAPSTTYSYLAAPFYLTPTSNYAQSAGDTACFLGNATSTALYVASGTFGDIECVGLQWGAAMTSFLFTPSSVSSAVFNNSLIQFEGLFPFDIFYQVANTFNQGTTQTLATGTLAFTVPTDWGLVQSTTISSNGQSSTIVILSPTMISDYAGSTFAGWYFGIIDMVEWVVLGYGIWKIIF